MKELELEFGDLSGHPPPPQVSLEVFERSVLEFLANNPRPPTSHEEIVADFMKNEGRQTEPWPDFGAR